MILLNIDISGERQYIEKATSTLYNKWFSKPPNTYLYSKISELYLRVEKHTKITGRPKITFHMVRDKKAVTSVFNTRYQKHNFNSVAFCSFSANTVWISAEHISEKIVLHEIGHLLFQSICTNRVSSSLHEHVAHFCERLKNG